MKISGENCNFQEKSMLSHRITEQLKLEGTSGGHLVTPVKQGNLEPVAQDHI